MATLLDQEHIERSAAIAPRGQDVKAMPDRPGNEVSLELGGRLLVRYLTDSQVTEFLSGSTGRAHWTTPTPIAPEAVVPWLALYAPTVARRHALILEPAKIPVIRGPAWIRLGQGVEYFLPDGFPADAIVDVGVVQVT